MKKKNNCGYVDLLTLVACMFIFPFVGLFMMGEEETKESGQAVLIIGLIIWGLMLYMKMAS